MSDTISAIDVLKRMVDTDDPKIELASLGTNLLNLKKVKHGTEVTIGVSGDRVGSIYNGKYVGGLILADKERFEEVKAEMLQDRKPSSDCTTNHTRLDFDTLRGALRMAGVTPKELSGDRMYEVLPKVVEILNAGLEEQVKPATIGVGYGQPGEKPQ